MTLNQLDSELKNLNEIIEHIFNLVNYRDKYLLESIAYAKDNPDDLMKFFEFQSIFYHLDFVHSLLSYLQNPICHTGILFQNESGHYSIDNIILKTGDIIEILSPTEYSETPLWHTVCLKSNLDFTGKQARFRGVLPPHMN